MTIAANIEWKLEAAFISVLTDAVDVVPTVRRARDQSVDAKYPVITVQCNFARNADWSVRGDYTTALVDIRAKSYRYTDTTGELASNYIGAIRDVIYGNTFIADMTGAVAGFTFYGATLEEGAVIIPDDTLRIHQITPTCHASAFAISDVSSASSSSSP